MKSLYLFVLVLAGMALWGLAGCYGPAPGLDPVITLVFDRGSNWPNISAGSTLVIEGTASAADDTSNNPIVEAQWSQSPAIPGSSFLVTSRNSLTNLWIAPTSVADPTPVVLSLHVRSLLGGQSTTRLHLVLVPRGAVPQYEFDYATMTAENPGFPNVTEGTMVRIRGAVSVPAGDAIDAYEWVADPDKGAFDSTTTSNPLWTAPVLELNSDGIPIPIAVKLKVTTRSLLGYVNTNTLLVNVVP